MSDFLYEVDGHLARLTMNRPEHLNCFSEEMIHLWTAALEDIRDRTTSTRCSCPATARPSAPAAT